MNILRSKHFTNNLFAYISIILFFAFSIMAHAQISLPGIPESFNLSRKKSIVLPEKVIAKIDIESLIKEDFEKGISNRYGISRELSINIRDSSLRTEIPGKGHIWQYEIKTETAFSLGVLFSSYHLPEGASVFLFTPDHSKVLGAFTSLNNNPDSLLAIADIKENRVIIEYFEPLNADFQGELILGSVSLAYRDIFSLLLATRVGINCPQGANWQDEKHAIARMTFRDTDGAYYCTGSFMNNTRNDLAPYFLTASHCISTKYSASTLVTYFNFENSGCYDSDANEDQTVSGASLVSNNAYSDFSLLLLNSTPPSEYKTYLAGWDASGAVPQSGAGIHHPSGTPKCISIENNPFVFYTGAIEWTGGTVSAPRTHWLVRFNNGVTEGGSSGSPLFDENHRVVGQLHGGDDVNSFYGAFHISWSYKTGIEDQLKHWLDPENTGLLKIDGKFLNAVPESNFSTPFPKVCLNNVITLYDNSKYDPTEWKWEISPSDYQFENGTDNTFRNPDVRFTRDGFYSIKLIAGSKWGSDTLVKEDYVEVVSEISVSLENPTPDNLICGCDLANYPIKASGANTYAFSFSRPEKVDLAASGDVVVLTVKESEKKYGTFQAFLKVEGSIGSCKSNDSIQLRIVLPGNDNIEDAFFIYPGNNGPFSNNCASGQVKEAFPAPINCYSNTNWCPGTTDEKIQNSIWFCFAGPTDGIITIDTKGVNNRIAVYDTDSAQYIISGRPTMYHIIGANDDRSVSDNTALLKDLDIVPGKKYWLQVETLDSDTGNISISLLSNGIELFPNPGTGKFDVLISKASEGRAMVSIYSSAGKLVISDNPAISTSFNRLSYDLSSNPSGLYYIKVHVDGNEYSKKVLIVH